MSDETPLDPPSYPPPPPQSPPPYQPPPPAGPPPLGSSGGGSFPGAGHLETLPWLRRDQLGTVAALTDTLKALAGGPAKAFRGVRADGDYVSPFLFALIVGWIGTAIGQVWSLAFSSAFGSMGQSALYEQLRIPAPEVGIGSSLSVLVLFPFILPIGLFIGSGIIHLCLLVTGALESSESGFEGTFNVVSYSQVSSLANVVPFVGPLIGLAVFLVLAVIGCQELHRTSTAKAAIAVLIPMILCCVCIAGSFVILAVGMAGAMAGL